MTQRVGSQLDAEPKNCGEHEKNVIAKLRPEFRIVNNLHRRNQTLDLSDKIVGRDRRLKRPCVSRAIEIDALWCGGSRTVDIVRRLQREGQCDGIEARPLIVENVKLRMMPLRANPDQGQFGNSNSTFVRTRTPSNSWSPPLTGEALAGKKPRLVPCL